MGMGTPAQQELGRKFFSPFFTWPDDAKLREWLRAQDPDELEQFLDWFDFTNYRDRKTLGRQELRKLRDLTVPRKEEGHQGQDIQANAFVLLRAIERATRGSAVPVALEQLRDLQMTQDEAKAAFLYLKDKGWIDANFRIFYAARMSAAGHDAIQEPETASAPQTGSAGLAFSDEPLTEDALAEIRATLATIRAQLPVVAASNTVKAEIDADVTQIEVEANRPAPRRRFIRLYLESLRDNLAKAAGAGTVALIAAVGALLAKHFGVL